jgi:hypothetical protein
VTGGTTLIVHVLTPTHVYTANVGDCKSVLSSRGACVELNTCHNPNVPSERDRFQASWMQHACRAAPGEMTTEKPQRRICDRGLAAPGLPLGTPRRQQLLAALWRTCCLLRASAAPLAVDWWVDLLGPRAFCAAGGGHLLLSRSHRRVRHQRVPHTGRLRPGDAAQGQGCKGPAAGTPHLRCGVLLCAPCTLLLPAVYGIAATRFKFSATPPLSFKSENILLDTRLRLFRPAACRSRPHLPHHPVPVCVCIPLARRFSHEPAFALLLYSPLFYPCRARGVRDTDRRDE